MDYPMSGGCSWVTNKEKIVKFLEKIQEVNKRLDTKFNEFSELAGNDVCNITKDNIMSETNANIGKYQRWLDRLFKEQRTLNNFKTRKIKMETEIYHYYRNNCDISEKIKYDSTADKYVKANECCSALNETISNSQALIDFIEGIIKNLNHRNFAIKNMISIWSAEIGELS